MPKVAQPLKLTAPTPIDETLQLWTVNEVALFMRRTPRAIMRWRAQGLINFVRPANGAPLVPRSEIARLLGEAATP
jgi:hypothetical protein